MNHLTLLSDSNSASDTIQRNFHLHPSPEKTVSDFLEASHIIVDVRSPGEYAAGHIPNSVNIPLFDNKERETIGRVYKHYGKHVSVDMGYNMIGTAHDQFLERFRNYLKKQPIGVTCARGGMRSSSVVNFLNASGVDAFRLKGGYKQYRNYILDRLNQLTFPGRVFVIHGFTGAGKTQLLKMLPNSICLESLAGHRNSIFGGIGLKRVTQKNFEAALHSQIYKITPGNFMVVEGEGRKIGDLHMPKSLCELIRAGQNIFMDTSFDIRVNNTLQNYGLYIKSFKTEFLNGIRKLTAYLGNAKVNTIIEAFNGGDYQTVTEILLRDYYDKKYIHSYKQYQFALTVNGDCLSSAANEILAFTQKHQ